MTNQQGTPLVRTRVKDVNKDSIFLRLYFSTLFRKFDTVTIQTHGQFEKNTLKTDSLYTNVQLASWGLNISGQDSTFILVIAKFQDECTGNFDVVHDTISLIKRDNLHYLLPSRR